MLTAGGVRHQFGIGVIRRYLPDLAALEILKQPAIVFRTKVTRPDNWSGIDIGGVVNPLLLRFATGHVHDNDEMTPAQATKVRGDLCSRRLTPINTAPGETPGLLLEVPHKTQEQHEKQHRHRDACEE